MGWLNPRSPFFKKRARAPRRVPREAVGLLAVPGSHTGAAGVSSQTRAAAAGPVFRSPVAPLAGAGLFVLCVACGREASLSRVRGLG